MLLCMVDPGKDIRVCWDSRKVHQGVLGTQEEISDTSSPRGPEMTRTLSCDPGSLTGDIQVGRRLHLPTLIAGEALEDARILRL